jgi:hypothetical protein
MCSFLSKNGKHLVLLAISGVEDVLTTFGSDEKGDVTLQVILFSGMKNEAEQTRFEMTQPRKEKQR